MTMVESARSAVLPWKSVDAATIMDSPLPQQDIDICLCCEHCSDACDRCDGRGNISRKQGRPRAEIDVERLRDLLRLRLCNKEICAALGVSASTLLRTKKRMEEPK